MSQSYDLCNDNLFKEKPLVTLGERRFYLNNSKCKFVAVSLCYDFGLIPCVQISGNKNDHVVFNEVEWKDFLSYQGLITNYLYTDECPDPVDAGKFSLDFKQLPFAKVVKISKDNSYVYLAYDTICTLWDLLPLIKYRIDILKRQQFGNYFKILSAGLRNMSGDVVTNTLKLLQPEENPNSENISMIMEFLYLYTELFKEECFKVLL